MEPDPALRRRLEEAAEGLVYSSESDEPFEYVAFPGAGRLWPMGAAELAALAGAPPGAPAEERALDHFLMRHIETSDPYDVQAQRIRPRYERLRELLRQALGDVRVFRVGRIRIDCYVVGADGRGNVVGMRTVAVET